MRDLLDRFVRVRIARANRLDLSLFQFDADMTLAVFFLNADGALYGRFGSRSNRRDTEREISFEGLRKAMETVLAWHESYPQNKALFVGKKGPPPRFEAPEAYPWMKAKGFEERCMSCHYLHSAERMFLREAGQPLPDRLLFPWPMPDTVGMALSPEEMAKVVAIAPESFSAKAGFEPGDEILTLDGQPMVSIADVQWVLHNAGEEVQIEAEILRDGKRLSRVLSLTPGWRRSSDISWRFSTALLRDRALGGLELKELSAEERAACELSHSHLALRVSRQPPSRSEAYQAGFREGDVIVAFDDRRNRMTESDLLAYCFQEKKPGDEVAVVVRRGGERIDLRFTTE